jgi:hypothetical protein
MVGERHQPRPRRASRGIETACVPPHADERFLDDVLRGSPVTEHADRHAQHHRAVALVQLVHRRAIAGADTLDHATARRAFAATHPAASVLDLCRLHPSAPPVDDRRSTSGPRSDVDDVRRYGGRARRTSTKG